MAMSLMQRAMFLDDRGEPVEVDPRLPEDLSEAERALTHIRATPMAGRSVARAAELPYAQRATLAAVTGLAALFTAYQVYWWNQEQYSQAGWRSQLAAMGALATAGGIVTLLKRRLDPEAWKRSLAPVVAGCLMSGLCGGCGYRLRDAEQGEDGCTRCSECGAAWDMEAWARDWRALEIPLPPPKKPRHMQVAADPSELQYPNLAVVGRLPPFERSRDRLAAETRRVRRWAYLGAAAASLLAMGVAAWAMETANTPTRDPGSTVILVLVVGIMVGGIGLRVGGTARRMATIRAADRMARQGACPCCGGEMRRGVRGRAWSVCRGCACIWWTPEERGAGG